MSESKNKIKFQTSDNFHKPNTAQSQSHNSSSVLFDFDLIYGLEIQLELL